MAKPSRLQVEIELVEKDINVLSQAKEYIAQRATVEDVDGDISVLEKVRARLCAALPPPRAEAQVVKRSRKKGMSKKDSEA